MTPRRCLLPRAALSWLADMMASSAATPNRIIALCIFSTD